MKLIIQLVLWVVIGFLGYLTFMSIYEPIQFEKVKEERYQKVIDKMKEIREAQLAYKEVTGEFSPSFDSLTHFLDTARFTLTERRDTSILDKEYQETYGVDKYVEEVVVDTIGSTSVKDSLYKAGENYQDFKYVPTTDKKEFSINADSIYRNERQLPVFEVKVDKKVILADQEEDLIKKEKQKVSVDDVNGEFIILGSMNEVNTNGNWPKFYGKDD